MGIHLYVPDEEDRGTNWDCSVDELLQYTSSAESQQVLAPEFLSFPILIRTGLVYENLLAWRLTSPECLFTTSLIWKIGFTMTAH
jgi:hypothetical protein